MVADALTGPVHVRFDVRRDGTLVAEDDLPPASQWPGSLDEAYGRIRISAPGIPDVTPEDELLALVTNVCFRLVSAAARQGHAVISYFASYGYFRVDIEASLARISGDAVPDVRVPALDLLEGLVECGRRYLRWRSETMTSIPDELVVEQAVAEDAVRNFRN